ncbi:asparagine synthase C-terminal domain-containing protein [Sphingopyxis sp.]|uniref:asparagine synthase C-terminal domain-containing protein n=1 Tax=Sphingopyxis sp. TaxID=1908224 RepID=UPI002D78D5EE|nr:asparagine synthase C-terminal domain-containing protein [Sphingopyxis sp.]HET6523210.1 asparagine synthase C-terminal domain-containing protein [Sphingopyxis sp.]
MPIDAHTVVVGHLFKRGSPSRRITNLQEIGSEKLLADRGRMLLADYWGGYVLVHARADGRIKVLRDPSGILPCYVRTSDMGVTLAGDITDLAHPGPGRVDFREVARLLASGDARGRRTCIEGIDELIAGECLVVDGSDIRTEAWWTPWHHVAPPRSMAASEAAAGLRDTITDCVGAWAGCFPSILLGVSGGLDSSIVAAAAAPTASRLNCLTLFGPDADGDERRYARALTDALGVDLHEMPRQIDDIDVTRAPSPHHPWPVASIGKLTNEAIHGRLAQGLAIDAHFSGNGGDGIFCSTRSAVPFLDRYLAEGPHLRLADTLRDICMVTGADRMTVLRYAWDRYRRNGGSHRARYNGSGIAPNILEELEAEGSTHPWFVFPKDALPGKTVHVAYLMRSQKGIELYPRAASPPHIAPLQSQPIVELCLSIPTWIWVADGLNRAVARLAFEGILPPLILRRTQKGGPGGFDLAIYQRHRAALVDRLRHGRLAEAGMLDLAFLDEAEDPTWRGTERIQRILDLAAAENWVDWWSGPRA